MTWPKILVLAAALLAAASTHARLTRDEFLYLPSSMTPFRVHRASGFVTVWNPDADGVGCWYNVGRDGCAAR